MAGFNRRNYTDETKAACLAALMQGQAVTSVAKEYKIPKRTISAWKIRMGPKWNEGREKTIAAQKDRIGHLLIEYMEASIKSLKIQAEHFADKEWLKGQDASSLAVLHGVQTDKAIRLLEALGGASSNAEG